MKTLSLLLFGLASGIPALGQLCHLPIPANAVIIDANGTYDVPSSSLWVCPGVTATIIGNELGIYMEMGCSITLNGQMSGVYVASGGTLVLNGDDNSVLYAMNSTVTDNGNGNSSFVCPQVTYDYSNAPAAGCGPSAISAMASDDATNMVVLFDASADHIQVMLEGVRKPFLVRVFDPAGKLILTENSTGVLMINMTGRPSGTYLILADWEGGGAVRKVAKAR